MINQNRFYLIIIGILITIILLQKCGGDPTPNIKTIRTIDTIYEPVIKEIPTYIPKWSTKIEYVPKYIHDTLEIIDTLRALNDYLATYFYQDSLINDTLSLYINDSISRNKIKSRDLKYVMSFPTIKITDVVIQNKNEYYIGLGLIGNQKGINYFGPEFLLRTKKKDVYGIGVGLDGNLQPNLSLRTYWKIGKK
jgi:hypothetical protein